MYVTKDWCLEYINNSRKSIVKINLFRKWVKVIKRHFIVKVHRQKQAHEKIFNIIGHYRNANRTMRYLYTHISIAKIKIVTTPNDCKDVKKLNHLHIADENVK